MNKRNSKGMVIGNILGVVTSILGIVGIAIAGTNYINNVDSKVIAQSGRIDNVESQVGDFKTQVGKILDMASSAKNDAAATRAYTEFIVHRLGGSPQALFKEAATTTP